MSSVYDVVVVGAGIHGLCAAHTFLSIDPSLKLLIVDDKASVGGVWSTEQLYPGLATNNLQGWYEFSDFPILQADLGEFSVSEKQLLTGKIMNAYFTKYAERFGLLDRIQFRTRVTEATYKESEGSGPWTVLLESDAPEGGRVQSAVVCRKLIVATGQSSRPSLPSIPGASAFYRPILHSESLGKDAQRILNDESKRSITILGGSKSAHDAVYIFASAGKRVTWISRRTGRGFIPMANTYTQMGPWRVWLEGLLMTRILSWFGPAPWSTGDGFDLIRWLLHSTAAGRWLVRGYWAGLSADSAAQSGVLKNEKTKMLVPDQNMMWVGTQANSLTYETDFYELVSGDNVEIIREDIAGLEEGALLLADGRKIETDLLLCATGYKVDAPFAIEPSSLHSEMGVPVDSSKEDDSYHPIIARADKELFSRFPELRDGPASKDRHPQLTPWRLWRFMAPPSQVCDAAKRSLIFFNAVTSYQTCLRMEITSLWAYAYLYDELLVKPKSEKEVRYEATLWSRFGKWSRPMGYKGKIGDLFMDSMPYYDLLLRDLGLKSWRKGWGIFGEVFGKWYEVSDFRGLLDEWKAARQARAKKTV